MEHALTTWTYLFIYSSDQYSFDLPQSGMQIPGKLPHSHTEDRKIHFQICAGILNYGIFSFGNSTEEQINFVVQKYVQVCTKRKC